MNNYQPAAPTKQPLSKPALQRLSGENTNTAKHTHWEEFTRAYTTGFVSSGGPVGS